jgi:Ca2+-binding RTX toxin-like protein
MAVVGAFLVGCAVLLMVVGCAGVRSEAPQKEEQARSDRCEGTRTIDLAESTSASGTSAPAALFITNDLPGCPKGGLLLGTDKRNKLAGQAGEDEVRGLGGSDAISGGLGSDVIYGGRGGDHLQAGGWLGPDWYWDYSKNVLYGGPGRDTVEGEAGDDVLYGGDGDDKWIYGGMRGTDVFYGGDGNDLLASGGEYKDTGPDKFYCGKGRDRYVANKGDYVDSSCEEKAKLKGKLALTSRSLGPTVS